MTGLLGDSGMLTWVTGVADGDQFVSLVFGFANGDLVLASVDDTSEIRVDARPAGSVPPVASPPALADLVGAHLVDAWIMANHRWYTDAAQLRFAHAGSPPMTRQFEVVSSGMYVYRVQDAARPVVRAARSEDHEVMDEPTADFINETDVLLGVSARLGPRGGYKALVFSFADGDLVLQATADQQLRVSVEQPLPAPAEVDHPLLEGLTGRRISYAWEMVNRRGFADALQMRLMTQGQPDLLRQFDIVASEVVVYHVDEGS